MTQQKEADAILDRITKELEKTIKTMQQTQTTMFFVLEENRRMRDLLFSYADGLNDSGEAARKFLNGERDSNAKSGINS